MIYNIDTSMTIQLNWNANGKERIVQNVINAISTWKREVAYNRNMGISSNLLDSPKNIAVAKYISEIYRVVPEYEPRATVKEVDFINIDDNGNMQFKVVIEI